MPDARARAVRLLPLALGLFALALPACYYPVDTTGYETVELVPEPRENFSSDEEYWGAFESMTREALLTAKPGTIFLFPSGTWPMSDELSVDVSHTTEARPRRRNHRDPPRRRKGLDVGRLTQLARVHPLQG